MSCQSSQKACKLCHGQLDRSASAPQPPVRAFGADPAPSLSEECHAHCATFACPGCVERHRETYSILNLKNHIYDYHCGSCMAEVPASRRGSMQSEAGSELDAGH